MSFAALEASDFDGLRLSEVRGEVHERLVELSRSVDPTAPRATLVPGFEAFEAALAGRLTAWPIPRIVEGLAADADPALAAVALRYLGLRGGPSSARVLERALEDEALAAAAVEALCDRDVGERWRAGSDGLLAAYWGTPHHARVRQHVSTKLEGSPAELIAWVRAAVRAEGGGRVDSELGARRRALLALLEGAPGDPLEERTLDLLFDLVGENAWKEPALAALERSRSATEAYLVDSLLGDGRRHSETVLLDVIERIGSAVEPEGLAWVVDVCRYGVRRDRALDVLAQLPGEAAVASLLDVRREFSHTRFLSVWGRALRADSDRFTDHAWRLRADGARAEATELVGLLLESGESVAVPAITVLAACDALADDDRERALLIAGELGRREHVDDLRNAYEALEHDEPHLAAACLWSARQLGGLADEEEVQDWLEAGSGAKCRRVLELLAPDAVSPDAVSPDAVSPGAVSPGAVSPGAVSPGAVSKGPSTGTSGASMRRFRLARELEPVLSIRDESARFARSSNYETTRGTTP